MGFLKSIESVLFSDPIFTTIIFFFMIVVVLVIYLIQKLHLISNLKQDLNAHHKIIRDLDRQAKLIIKSDMELKLYQQEIEDKLSKLTSIKELIISSMHILSRDDLFNQLTKKAVNSLGFKNGLLLDFSDLEVKANIGFNKESLSLIANIIKYKKETFKGVQILPSNSDVFKQIVSVAGTKDILVAPIKDRENVYAVFIVSGLIISTEVKKPEEEAFLIVCMHLSQCLDKIRLFEGLYHTKDDLEKKVKERTNELVKSLREIEVISKAKSDFISSVSHELRTPLTSVKGFSSLLVEDKFGKLPPEAKDRLSRIDENVNRLMDIVNTLLDIARIESGKMEVKIAPSEIIKLITDVTGFLSPQFEEKSMKLVLELPKMLEVHMDKNLIERVLINLINNAIKFTANKGTITVNCQQKSNQALISIKDTGCGMNQDDLEKIFQDFYRVKNQTINKIPGTGLGLSLVKRIIDTHKEKIWVESKEGVGTVFYFTLRVVKNA